MSSDPLRTETLTDARRSVGCGSRRQDRAAAPRRTRPLLRRPLRARHQRLDARAVFRSQPCPRPRVHRTRAQRAGRTSARRPRSCCRAARRRSVAATRGEARRLLQAAIDGGAPLEDAFPMLERLNRMDPLPAAPPPARSQGDRPAHAAPRSAGRRAPAGAGDWPGRIVDAARARRDRGLRSRRVERRLASAGWPAERRSTATLAPVARDVVLAFPQRGEMALTRARSLAAGGALHDALSVLDGVRATDPQKPDADRLRADLQRELLRLGAERLP